MHWGPNTQFCILAKQIRSASVRFRVSINRENVAKIMTLLHHNSVEQKIRCINTMRFPYRPWIGARIVIVHYLFSEIMQ